MMKFKKNQKGYSLPQMLTATAVGAVLTGVATTNYWSAVDKSRVTAEMETIERIAEAVNVVLASDEGRTTFLADAHRELFQELIPETGEELTYAIRSSWKGTDAVDGNHQYALSLDIYPRYIGTPADYSNAKVKAGGGTAVTLGADNKLYQLAASFTVPLSGNVLANTKGYTGDGTKAYAVAYQGAVNAAATGNYVVLEKATSGTADTAAKIVAGATVTKSAFDTILASGVVASTVTYNPIGMQKIGLMAKALDAKMDAGDGKDKGSVHYDDTCDTSGIDACFMHVYLVDKGLSYDEDAVAATGDDWHSEKFKTDMKKAKPTSTVLKVGQDQSTVVLGKNGD